MGSGNDPARTRPDAYEVTALPRSDIATEPGPAAHPPPTGGVAARSAAWSLSGSCVSAVLILVRSIVVARLLVPSEFGRFALVATVLGVLEVVSQPALEVAALQRRQLTNGTLETLWSALILRSLALTTALFLLAEPLSELLGAGDSVGLLRAIAFVPLVRSLASMAVLAEAHRVNLGPQFRLQVIGQLTETAVAIVACALTGSAAALVVALLAGTATEVVGSWCVRGFKPRLRLVGAELWPLLRFSRWAFASNVLGYLSRTCDDLAVGRFAGTRALGLYRVAYRLGNLPTTQISHAVGQVAFPFFSRLQDAEPGKREEMFLRYLALTSATAGFVAVLLAATAQDLVVVVLGRPWAEAGGVLAILATAGFVRAILASGGTYFMAGGQPQLDTSMQALRLAVLAGGLLVMLGTWGIEGAAVASLLSVVATVPFWLRGLRRLGYSPPELMRTVARPLPAVGAAGLGGLATSAILSDPLASLLTTSIVVLSSWLTLTAVLHPDLRRELVLVLHHLRPSTA